jgi:GT2 family glycosyltransferase
MNKVLIIIVSYNGQFFLERLLCSIINFEQDSDVIVIDNNSQDQSIDILEKFKTIKLIKLNQNIGFGAANNIGLKYAIDNAYNYVFLFNQDTYLTESIFTELINTSNSKNNYCLLSPLQKNGTGTKLELSFEKFLYESGFISQKLLYPDDQLYNLSFIQAASWFIPIEIVKLIGGFDPIFFHYGEDNNYCQRLEFFNVPIYIVQTTSICHDSNPFNENYPRDYGSYHLNRLKSNFLIKYSNINLNVKMKSYNLIIIEFIKKGFIFFLKLQFRRLIGLYKYSIFQIRIRKKIIVSVEKNKIVGMNYLN